MTWMKRNQLLCFVGLLVLCLVSQGRCEASSNEATQHSGAHNDGIACDCSKVEDLLRSSVMHSKSAQAKAKSLQAELKAAQSKMQAMQQENSELQTKLDGASSDLDAAKAELEQTNAKLATSGNEKAELEKQLEAANAAIDDTKSTSKNIEARHDAKVKELEAQASSLADKIKSSQSNLDAAEADKLQLQKALDEATAALDATKSKSQNEAKSSDARSKELKDRVSAMTQRIEELKDVITRAQQRNDALRDDKAKLSQRTKEQQQELRALKDAQFMLRQENYEQFQEIQKAKRDTLWYRLSIMWSGIVTNPEIKNVINSVEHIWGNLKVGRIELPRDGFVLNAFYRVRRIYKLVTEETNEFLHELSRFQAVYAVLKFRHDTLEFIDRTVHTTGSVGRRYCILQEGPDTESILHSVSCYLEENNEQITDSVEVAFLLLVVPYLAMVLCFKKKPSVVDGGAVKAKAD